MKKIVILSLLLTSALLLAAPESAVEPLPDAVSNNAVAMLKVRGQLFLFSFMGIGPKKTWDAVTTAGYALDAGSGKAEAIRPVPGTAGRIGAMAAAAAERIFVFGGYVVYQGGGTVVPDVNVYDPDHDRWLRTSDIPIPVGDAVIGVYRDRYIYLVGGRTKAGPISDVQVYDLEKARWLHATPTPGPAVFGHAGTLVDDKILYVDGARRNPESGAPKYIASDECWLGKIDHHDPTKIEWSKMPAHPGAARFHIAAAGSEKDDKVYFAGGSENPHDYNGIGFDGKPAEPSPVTFAFDLHTGKWETLDQNTPDPTMDHRGLLVTRENLVIIGGMEKGQQVTARITVLPKQGKGK